MAVWPKFVYTFNVSRRMAATQRQLRDVHAAAAQQDATFRSLLPQLAASSYWKQHGMERGITYAQFQARVPLQTHAQLAPAIAQMTRGERDVLWPGACTRFGLTSGTSTGQPRCLPMTEDLIGHFRHAGFEALMYYTARVGNAGIFKGRHFYCGSPSPPKPTGESVAGVQPAEVSQIMAASLPAWAARHLYEPAESLTSGAPHPGRLESILARNITLIGGLPGSVALLAQALKQKTAQAGVPENPRLDCWPNLECLVHTGAPLSPHISEIKAAFGSRLAFHEIFAASEGIIAAQDGDILQGLRLMTETGVFFEFVPLTDFDDLRLDRLSSKVVPMTGVRKDVDYVILLTTPGGLARYVLGDVVRFTSTTPPRLIVVGGTQLRLNALGENVSEREVTSALVELCERRGWTLVNFHVAPLFPTGVLTGQRRGAHEWWVELKPGTTVTPTGPQMAVELDASIRALNSQYAAKRASGVIQPPVVRLVMPGVFEHWMRFRDKLGGQRKMPRCLSERSVADEFAAITNFAQD